MQFISDLAEGTFWVISTASYLVLAYAIGMLLFSAVAIVGLTLFFLGICALFVLAALL